LALALKPKLTGFGFELTGFGFAQSGFGVGLGFARPGFGFGLGFARSGFGFDLTKPTYVFAVSENIQYIIIILIVEFIFHICFQSSRLSQSIGFIDALHNMMISICPRV